MKVTGKEIMDILFLVIAMFKKICICLGVEVRMEFSKIFNVANVF